MAKLKITFVTDYVCPYCIAAKVPLMKAARGRDVEIQWIPMELTLPGKPQVDTYNDPVRKEKWAKGLIPFCEKQGLPVHIPPHVVPRPYTHLAFLGYFFACDCGCGEEWNSRMYELYFTEEQDIGDLDVLRAEAERLGMNGPAFVYAVTSGLYEEKLWESNRYAREVLKVKGIPAIWVNDTFVLEPLMREKDYAAMLDHMLEQSPAPEKDHRCGKDDRHGQIEDEPTVTGRCGPDGC